MSKAADVLAALQMADPVPKDNHSESRDRVLPLLNLMGANLPVWTTQLQKAGKLIAGEVGLRRPDAFAESFDDGSHSICVTTGYIRLVYAAAKYFAAQLKATPDGHVLTPSLSTMDAAVMMAALLEQYRAGLLHGGYGLDAKACPLSAEQEDRAHALTDAALLFTVLHELGHVSIKVNNIPLGSKSEEQEADTFAFCLFLSARERVYLPWNYAGALFALRLHDCLEKAGFEFKDKAAPFRDRLRWVQGAIRASFDRMIPKEVAWVEVVMELFFRPVEWSMWLLGEPGSSDEPSKPAPKPRGRLFVGNEARSALKAMQEKHPLWEFDKHGNPYDQTRWFMDLLEPLIPYPVKDKIASGDVVIGEVGEVEAYARVEVFCDETKVITVSSGLLALLRAVAQFLQLRVKVRLSPTHEVGNLVTQEVAVAYIAELLVYGGRGKFDRAKITFTLPGFWHPEELQWYRPEPQPLTKEQDALSGELYEGAAAFVLLSRIMEAVLDRSSQVPEVGVGAAGAVLAESLTEVSPEVVGATLAMTLFQSDVPRLGFRRTYAALLLATRVERGLALARGQRIGSRAFGPEQVRSGAWSNWDAEAVQALKMIGEGYDGLMSSAEDVLVHNAGTLRYTDVPPIVSDPRAEERAWARACVAPWISGALYQCVVASDVSKAEVLRTVVDATNSMGSHALEDVAGALFDKLLQRFRMPEDRPEHADAVKEMEILDWLIVKLPDKARAVFENARKCKCGDE